MRSISPIILNLALCVPLLLSGCSDAKKKPTVSPVMYQPDFGRGMHVYNAHCAGCHSTGSQDAPILRDPEEWDFWVFSGLDIRRDHTAKGFLDGYGPATRGTLSDENIADALHYIARRLAEVDENY